MNYDELTDAIKKAYTEGVTITEAESLAAKFLHAQMCIAEDLKIADLDARMKKAGNKAIRAAIYLKEVKAVDKKPSDTMLEALVNMDELAIGEQGRLDEAEVERDRLQAYFNVFREGHIYFRGISKGRYE